MKRPLPGRSAAERRGHKGEAFAAFWLRLKGWRILARRLRTPVGEIDIVAYDGRTLVFCEVKSRRTGSGRPWDSLHLRKRAQVRRMAAAYLTQTPERPRGEQLRFDAIGVVLDPSGRLAELEHLEAAF